MTTNRYAVVDVPTAGTNKGKITKVWDFDLTKSDAELLKKRIANKRLSKSPVVLTQDACKDHPHLDDKDVARPWPHEMADLGIDPKKFAEMSLEVVKGLAGELGAVLDPLVAEANKPSAVHDVTPEQLASDPLYKTIAGASLGQEIIGKPLHDRLQDRKEDAPVEAFTVGRAVTDGPFELPPVTKRDDGAYVTGPPPDGRSVDEHLDELTRTSLAGVEDLSDEKKAELDAIEHRVVVTTGGEVNATMTFPAPATRHPHDR